jgi:hypothetical protein
MIIPITIIVLTLLLLTTIINHLFHHWFNKIDELDTIIIWIILGYICVIGLIISAVISLFNNMTT